MSESELQGWDLDNNSSAEDEQTQTPFSFLVKPINFLSQSYPLEPDMIFGWRPKLPLSPIPLTYTNTYVDWLVSHVHSDSRFRLVYLGNRPANSVKVNQMYDYSWKTRSRYNLNIQVLKDKIENVGLTFNRRFVRNSECDYKFSSSFESGNLDAAILVKPNEFDCFMRSDTNTRGHSNWFYFSVQNKVTGPLRLNICNITKYASLYCRGMKPYVNDGLGWRQGGEDVQFVQRPCRYGFNIKQWQLQFTYNFTEPNQTVQFAYSIPYTFSKLQGFIKEIKQNYSDTVECETLCQSLGGVSIPLITISTKRPSYVPKQVVLITGRMHPGESVSSYVIEGFIRTLLERKQEFKNLLRNYDFKIVPMLNPDGVIIGNFRTSYSGKDLNRQFFSLNKLVYPQISAINDLAVSLKKQYRKRFEYYFDMHGHSTKTNLFCYGPEHPRWNIYYLKCRAFAKIMQQADQIFSYSNSIFTISEHKKTTGRANMFLKHQIPYTYTFELSNGFYETLDKKLVCIDLQDMHRVGKLILNSFYTFVKMNAPSTVLSNPQYRPQRNLQRRSSTRMKQNIAPYTTMNIRAQETIKPKNLKRKQKVLALRTKEMRNTTVNTEKNIIDEDNIGVVNHQTALEELYKQIMAERIEPVHEGRSDSEDEVEDVNNYDLTQLHKQIQNRQIVENQPRVDYNRQPQKYQVKKLRKSTGKNKREPVQSQHQLERKKRQLTRSETSRIFRNKTQKVVKEKYLLAQKSFVLNL